MHRALTFILIFICFIGLFLSCYAPVLFFDRQFGYRDAGHYYYPLNQRVQEEWNQGRWPLWEPEENAGMPLLGNPTAAVLYPGKLIFALLPYRLGGPGLHRRALGAGVCEHARLDAFVGNELVRLGACGLWLRVWRTRSCFSTAT